MDNPWVKLTCHCSTSNFLVNLMAVIIEYCLSDDKPSLNLARTNALAKT